MIKEFREIFNDGFIQTFDDSKKGRRELVRVFPMSEYKQNEDILMELNKIGAGVFFTPNPCKGGRKESDVTEIRWIYVDLDEGTKEEMQARIKESPIMPHMIIESSRGYHLYWKAKMEKEDFKDCVKRLIHFYNGDPAISSTNEVLRMPGFFHMKDPANPFAIRIIFKKIPLLAVSAPNIVSGYPNLPEDPKSSVPAPNKAQLGDTMDIIKRIPILDILSRLGVDVRNNFIYENNEITSASINVKGNYINRFSGKDGSGSTIDACMNYGNMTKGEAIAYLKEMAGIDDVEALLRDSRTTDLIDDFRDPFTWGTPEADQTISPISHDSFVLFAGEAGAGKTAWTFDMAIKNANLGHSVLYLSLEMNTDAIFTRVARDYSGITKGQWRNRKDINQHQRDAYKMRKEELRDIKNLRAIGFSEGIPPTIKNIHSLITKLKPDIVFLDNFDLIAKDPTRQTMENETTTATQLMDICNQTPIPIVVIHHLRKSGGEDSKKPRGMDSVRGSGKIVDCADILVIGFRAPYNENMTDEEKASFHIVQKKDRDFGSGGFVKCYFNKGTFQDTLPMDLSKTHQFAQEIFGK